MKLYYILMISAGLIAGTVTDIHIPSDTGIMVKTRIEALRRYSIQHYPKEWLEMDNGAEVVKCSK
jgi:hypothetical protein